MAYAICSRRPADGCGHTCATKSSAQTLRKAIERTTGEKMKLVAVKGRRSVLSADTCRRLAKQRLRGGLRDHDAAPCEDMRSRTERAHGQMRAAIARGDDARTVKKLRDKLAAFKATMNAMGCQVPNLGRSRRR